MVPLWGEIVENMRILAETGTDRSSEKGMMSRGMSRIFTVFDDVLKEDADIEFCQV